MKMHVEVPIKASKEEIWKVISNIENSVNIISGIEEIEILEKPETGLVGLKWRETRKMFGKTASEIMWVTEVQDLESYHVRAESHGAIYLSTLYISQKDGENVLNMDFDGQPQTLAAKIMSGIFGFMFKKATKKALHQDLVDIKNAVEVSS